MREGEILLIMGMGSISQKALWGDCLDDGVNDLSDHLLEEVEKSANETKEKLPRGARLDGMHSFRGRLFHQF